MRMSLDNYKLFKMKMKWLSHFHRPYLSMTRFHLHHKSRPLCPSLFNTLERVNLSCLPLVLLSQGRNAICCFLPLTFFLKFHSEDYTLPYSQLLAILSFTSEKKGRAEGSALFLPVASLSIQLFYP